MIPQTGKDFVKFMELIRKYGEEVASTRKKAIKSLQKAGIVDKNGELTTPYR